MDLLVFSGIYRSFFLCPCIVFYVTDWTVRGSYPGMGKTFFFLVYKMSIQVLGPSQPLIHWVTGFFPGDKGTGRDIKHLLSSSGGVKNKWSCACAPSICLHGLDMGNLTFFIYIFLHVQA